MLIQIKTDSPTSLTWFAPNNSVQPVSSYCDANSGRFNKYSTSRPVSPTSSATFASLKLGDPFAVNFLSNLRSAFSGGYITGGVSGLGMILLSGWIISFVQRAICAEEIKPSYY